jgi:hypothetical protein
VSLGGAGHPRGFQRLVRSASSVRRVSCRGCAAGITDGQGGMAPGYRGLACIIATMGYAVQSGGRAR